MPRHFFYSSILPALCLLILFPLKAFPLDEPASPSLDEPAITDTQAPDAGEKPPENKKENEPASPSLSQGIADFKAENYEEASASLQNARKQEPNSSIAAYYLGLTYKQLQNYKEAASNLLDAETLEPFVVDGFLDLAEVYYLLGRNEDALEQIGFAEGYGVRPAQTQFLKGLILLKLDRNKEASEAFNSAKSIDPSMTQAANYQIGVVLIKQGNGEEAAKTFNQVIITDPNSDLAQFAKQYVEALARKAEEHKKLRLAAGIGWQYDSNVILKPSDQSIAGAITGEADSVYIYTLRAEYTPLLSGPFGVKAQYSIYYNDHERLGRYDVGSHTLSIIPSYAMKDGLLNLPLTYNYTFVDYTDYLYTLSASPGYTFMVRPGQLAQLQFNYQKKKFIMPPLYKDEDRDSDDYGGSLGWFYFFAGNKGLVNVKYGYNWEDTDGINWRYAGNKGNLNIVYPVLDNLKLNLSGEAYNQQYENINTSFRKKRTDTQFTGSAVLAYEVYKNIELNLQYTYINADSTISVYKYEKNVSGAGVEVRY